MPAKPIDMRGHRFGRLVAIEPVAARQHGELRWLCVCDCGKRVVVRGTRLRQGRNKSCGCLCREKLVAHNGGDLHGFSGERLYGVWVRMKSRCLNPNQRGFHNYGGRGIAVCDAWRDDYPTFRAWALANGYQPGLGIERLDVNGHYTPSNCSFIARAEQHYNRRDSRPVTRADGVVFTTPAAAARAVGGTPAELLRACADGTPFKGFKWSRQPTPRRPRRRAATATRAGGASAPTPTRPPTPPPAGRDRQAVMEASR